MWYVVATWATLVYLHQKQVGRRHKSYSIINYNSVGIQIILSEHPLIYALMMDCHIVTNVVNVYRSVVTNCKYNLM